MIQYREDEKGRLFRWDEGLRAWLRILCSDDEYELAAHVVNQTATGPVAGGPTAVRRAALQRDGHRIRTANNSCVSRPRRAGRARPTR